MTEIIKFPSRESLPAPEGRTGRGGRYRRNPLRRQLRLTSIAMVHLNKIDPQHTADDIEFIRRGVVAARVLADEIARLAAGVGCAPKGQPAKAEKDDLSYAYFLRIFRDYFVQEFAGGKDVVQIFDDLESGVAKRLGHGDIRHADPSPPKRTEDKAALARDLAFRGLDEQVSDLDRWAGLSASLVGECVEATVETGPELQIAYVVANHLREFVKDFKTKYYRAWKEPDGEVA
jgi:hypothetical protein